MVKFNFNINTLFLGALAIFLGYGVLTYYFQAKDPYEIPIGMLPVPIQVGKNKIIVSKTGDASMRTEYNRRSAIIRNNNYVTTPKFSFSGSTNGSLETFFLTSICPRIVTFTSIFDGGNAASENTFILDGNEDGILIDGGYADTTVCST